MKKKTNKKKTKNKKQNKTKQRKKKRKKDFIKKVEIVASVTQSHHFFFCITKSLWEGEAQEERIIGQDPPTEQWGPTMHQIKLSPVKMAQSEELRGATCPRGKYSPKDWGQTTKAIRLRAKQGRRDVQAREGGSFLIKHPSPLHLMHYTNLACYINGRMIPEQCSHCLQLTLPPPTR